MPSQNIVPFSVLRCERSIDSCCWQGHGTDPAEGMGRCLEAHCSGSKLCLKLYGMGKLCKTFLPSLLDTVTARRKARIQKCEIPLLEGLAFVAKGFLWVRKNNAVLASSSLPSTFLFSPLHFSWNLFSWSYDSGKCLEIRLCTEGVHSLPSSHHSLLLLGSPQLSSTPQSCPEQSCFARVASPSPGQAALLRLHTTCLLSWLWFVYGLVYKECQILSQVPFISA